MGRVELGRVGEDLAAEHVQRMGWQVLERNWRCSVGELDLIALQPGPEPVVVFCEVKSRRGVAFGPPLEAITAAKVAKLRELALHWLRSQEGSFPHVRFDGIGVLFAPDSPPLIRHVPGID